MTVRRLAAQDAWALVGRGEATLVDLRPPAEFARGHPSGALSLPFSARGLASRLEAIAPVAARPVLLANDQATEDVAVAQLAVRWTQVGVVVGGFAGWHAAKLPEAIVEEIDFAKLQRIVAAGGATILDVREPLEWSTGHVPGALLISLGRLRASLDAVPPGPVVVICEAGVRSCVAASLLLAAGRESVAHVPDGSSGYRRSGLPLAFPREDVLAR